MHRTYFKGTHRARLPAETLELIRPHFPRFGITRLADVTGLDTLGVPVVLAVRPLAATLSVSQGKGADLVSAQVSAAMEAIETWYAEYAVPPAAVSGAAAVELRLPYRIADMETDARAVATDSTRLDWVPAAGVRSGTPTLVPRAAVEMRWQPSAWPPPLIATSNGLASGNNRWEAVLHGLYEVAERDATAALADVPAAARTYVDPASVDEPNARALLDRLNEHGAWVELVSAPSRAGVTCFVCYLWSPGFGLSLFSGAGAHSDPAVALSRALTEAAQSQLTFITGTRDDIGAQVYRPGRRILPRPVTTGPLTPWREYVSHVPDAGAVSFEDEARRLAGRIEAVTGTEPLCVDLRDEEDFCVTKVFCPGLGHMALHDIPRHQEAATR